MPRQVRNTNLRETAVKGFVTLAGAECVRADIVWWCQCHTWALGAWLGGDDTECDATQTSELEKLKNATQRSELESSLQENEHQYPAAYYILQLETN